MRLRHTEGALDDRIQIDEAATTRCSCVSPRPAVLIISGFSGSSRSLVRLSLTPIRRSSANSHSAACVRSEA